MKQNRITLEQVFYVLALVIAAGIRFLALGRPALNDVEAVLALQVYDLLHGGLAALAPHPLYILGTALLGFLFGANNWVVRFLPAAVGTLLVLSPYFFRRELGRRAALILAFLIAFDPGLIASSVQAGSALLALACVLFALAGWVLRKPVLVGACAGLALLGGPGIWPGLLGLAIAAWVSYSSAGLGEIREPLDWRKSGLAALASLLLVGTLLLLVPAGINAAAASLPEYLSGWVRAGGVSLFVLLAALIAYQALSLVLGVGGVVRGLLIERSGLDLFLSVWWGAALVLALVYPARQVSDLVWAVFPMLALAARQIDRMLVVQPGDRLAVAGQAGLVLLLLLLITNLAISWPNAEPSTANQIYRWSVLALALILLVAETILVAWGWSGKIAVSGLMWGLSGLLALQMVSAGVHTANLTNRVQAELWRSGPAFAGSDLLLSTIRDYTQWTPDLKGTPQIVVAGLDAPAVRWALRDYPGLSVEEIIPVAAQPELLITGEVDDIEQAAAYTGQDFVLARSPAWDLISPSEWIQWLFYRSVKEDVWQTTQLILWVRADRFPGSSSQLNQP